MGHLVLFCYTNGEQHVFGKRSCCICNGGKGQRYQHQENIYTYNQMIYFME